jgi:hypothetical protein
MKRKILYLSDYAGLYSGFGRNTKALLSYLYRNYSDKFEIISVSGGMADTSNPDFLRFPWKTRGVLPPDQHILNELQKDPGKMQLASYGDMLIEKIVNEEKPDIIVAVQDEWGISFLKNKKFAKHIPIVYWSTLDSRPVMGDAIDTCSKTNHYWTWSDFSAIDLREKHGHKHAKCQYPCIDTSKFFRLEKHKKLELRKRFNIPENSIIYGFVFRNQIRKLVPRLIEGYGIFKKLNPNITNTYLYLHTNFSEGWDIPRLCQQYNVDLKEILCTYICKETKNYFVSPFCGQDIENPFIKKKTLITCNVQFGVTEQELNEIYNLFDFYIHPVSSGAAEIPCIEAALTELTISTCNYSFGEDIIKLNKGSFEIDFNFYTEIGTQFLKSNPSPNSISKLLKKFYTMEEKERKEFGKLSRKWALDNYSTEVNGKKIAEYLLNIEIKPYSLEEFDPLPNPVALLDHKDSNEDYINQLYLKILNRPADPSGFDHWIKRLQNGEPRNQIEKMFRQIAQDELNKKNQESFTIDKLLENNGKKNFILICPESAGDILNASALLQSFRQSYPENEWNLYFACKPEFKDLLIANPYITKILPYMPFMESEIACIGAGENKGLFHGYCFLTTDTQRHLSYLSNHNIGVDLKYDKKNENKCSQFNVHGVNKGKA